MICQCRSKSWTTLTETYTRFCVLATSYKEMQLLYYLKGTAAHRLLHCLCASFLSMGKHRMKQLDTTLNVPTGGDLGSPCAGPAL